MIPLFAALASTAVAVVSVRIAKRARDIAEDSEQARVQAEIERVRREQQQRLDTAIRDMFVGVANLIRDIEVFEKGVQNWLRNFSGPMEAKTSHPQPPSDMGLLALVAAARLEAEAEDERAMLDAVHKAITDMRKHDAGVKKALLAKLWEKVVDWRHASSDDRPKALEAFSAVNVTKTAEDATRQ